MTNPELYDYLYGDLLESIKISGHYAESSSKQNYRGIIVYTQKEMLILEDYLKVIQHEYIQQKYQEIDKDIYEQVTKRMEQSYVNRKKWIMTEGKSPKVMYCLNDIIEYLMKKSLEARGIARIRKKYNSWKWKINNKAGKKKRKYVYEEEARNLFKKYQERHNQYDQQVWQEIVEPLQLQGEKEQAVYEYMSYSRKYIQDIKQRILTDFWRYKIPYLKSIYLDIEPLLQEMTLSMLLVTPEDYRIIARLCTGIKRSEKNV